MDGITAEHLDQRRTRRQSDQTYACRVCYGTDADLLKCLTDINRAFDPHRWLGHQGAGGWKSNELPPDVGDSGMPRYFFHVRDGEIFRDDRGTELPDISAARKEAVRFASALLMEKPETFWDKSEWTMRVTDGNQLTLFSLTFFATDSAAAALQRCTK